MREGPLYYRHKDQGHVTWVQGTMLVTNYQVAFVTDSNKIVSIAILSDRYDMGY